MNDLDYLQSPSVDFFLQLFPFLDSVIYLELEKSTFFLIVKPTSNILCEIIS